MVGGEPRKIELSKRQGDRNGQTRSTEALGHREPTPQERLNLPSHRTGRGSPTPSEHLRPSAPHRTQASRRMWRYSLSNDVWREVTVPSWVDPTAPGAVFQGKVAFLGQCSGGALYDPVTDSWERLASEGGPPAWGRLWAVGDFLAVTDVEMHGVPTNEVWLLDLRK
jgi:hypothetical protein